MTGYPDSTSAGWPTVKALDGVTTPGEWHSRRKPPHAYRAALLEAQGHRCLYCGHPFGSTVWGDKGSERLKLNWDHFVPYRVLLSNPAENWIAACHLCNQIKRDREFDSLEEAQTFIALERERLGFPEGLWPLPERPDYQNLPVAVPEEPGYIEVSIKQIASFEDRLGKAARKADNGEISTAWIAVGRVQAEIRALYRGTP